MFCRMNADEVENVWHLALSYSSAFFILAEILLVENCAVSEIQCKFPKAVLVENCAVSEIQCKFPKAVHQYDVGQ